LRYKALRESVNLLSPIQIGLAIGGSDGVFHGAWNFNLHFDLARDLHREASVKFLRAAGVNFRLHARQGICQSKFGAKLAASPLVGGRGNVPLWITFSGSYDLGYLLKILSNAPLPKDSGEFEIAVNTACPKRLELLDQLGGGSLEAQARMRGVRRFGRAHTAVSDAMTTLDVFYHASGIFSGGMVHDCETSAHGAPERLENSGNAEAYMEDRMDRRSAGSAVDIPQSLQEACLEQAHPSSWIAAAKDAARKGVEQHDQSLCDAAYADTPITSSASHTPQNARSPSLGIAAGWDARREESPGYIAISHAPRDVRVNVQQASQSAADNPVQQVHGYGDEESVLPPSLWAAAARSFAMRAKESPNGASSSLCRFSVEPVSDMLTMPLI
jgi:CCR4-NOT transcription complex subunit 7/8